MSVAPPLPKTKHRRRFLGRYELIGELARGGMGTVFLARHAGEAGFQRMFAIKVLHQHLEEEATFVDMLRDEARIAARLHHPNVVAIVDLGSHGRQHYVVMDYVEGPSFATLWKRSSDTRPLALMLSIVIDTLDGLHAAHTLKDEEGADLQLVHRDVSPQNILVGVDGIARITDFGIAKAESRIGSTQPGMRKGKLQFMSPEQVKDETPVDRRTDVWAMGVVLWSMLASEHLFRAENDAATVHNILVKPIPKPSETKAKPPAMFDDIVLRALARNPDERFSSALEMADALRVVAHEQGMMGSRQQVASWVESTFSEELERRRQAIRDVVRKRTDNSDLMDYSQVTVLPSLPSALHESPSVPTKTENAAAKPPALPPGTALADTESGERLAHAVPANEVKTSLPPPLEALDALGAHELPDEQAKKRRTLLALGIAALLAVAVGVVVSSSRAPTPEPHEVVKAAPPAATPDTAAALETTAVAATAPALADAPKVKKSREVAPAVVATAEAPTEPEETAPSSLPSEEAPEPKAPSRAGGVRGVAALPRLKPIAPVAAPPAPVAAPRVDAPRPTPAQRSDEFETNPYLRH
jgi:serine/threonine-protein kinase